jgi:hypothetical protein
LRNLAFKGEIHTQEWTETVIQPWDFETHQPTFCGITVFLERKLLFEKIEQTLFG